MVSEEKFEEMVKKVKELEEKLNKNYDKKKDPGWLTSKKSFSVIQRYGGKADDFDMWKFRMATFLMEEPGWEGLLKALDTFTVIPSDAQLGQMITDTVVAEPAIEDAQEVKAMCKQLYQVLCMNLEDNALKGIRNLSHKEANGFLGWIKLNLEVTAMTGQRLQGLNRKVYQPPRVKKYQEVISALDSWEINKRELERHEGKTLMDSAAIFALKSIVPEELEKDIERSNTLRTFEEVKLYVLEQVTMRRDTKARGPVPMEVDYIKNALANLNNQECGTCGGGGDEGQDQGTEDGGNMNPEDVDKVTTQILSMEKEKLCNKEGLDMIFQVLSMQRKGGGKGGKGGGNGGGKGRFDGTCSHCGVYGHRLRDCWKKDKEMEEYRASKGGKGMKGKGQSYQGKGWQQQSGGWGQQWGWGQKGGGGYKGGYGGKGGKAQGTAMNLWAPQGYDQSTQATQGSPWAPGNPWSLCSLHKEGEWQSPKKATRANKWDKIIPPPPGLGKGFEVLTSFEAIQEMEECEADEEEYPILGSTTNSSKTKMPRMNNYSKGQIRRLQGNEGRGREGQGREKGNEGVKKLQGKIWIPKGSNKGNEDEGEATRKPCMMFMKAPPTTEAKELCPFIGSKPDEAGWRRVKGVMDSGASESVAPPTMCPNYKIYPSPGSIAGQNYVSASDDTIPNLGEQYLDIVTKQGRATVAKYQVADVTRPLNAVSEICDAGGTEGQLVVFGKNGGYVLNLENGQWTEFEREQGVYTLEFWVPPPGTIKEGGFTRQG